MRVTIKPSAAPDRELDLTGTLISAVATELWRNFGGNDVLNWMEAERFVQSLVRGEPVPMQAVEPRARHKPVRVREEIPRPLRRVPDDDRVTGPLPVY